MSRKPKSKQFTSTLLHFPHCPRCGEVPKLFFEEYSTFDWKMVAKCNCQSLSIGPKDVTPHPDFPEWVSFRFHALLALYVQWRIRTWAQWRGIPIIKSSDLQRAGWKPHKPRSSSEYSPRETWRGGSRRGV